MKRTTQDLLELLNRTKDFDIYMRNTKEELVSTCVSDSLEQLLQSRNISKSQCIKASGLDRTYAYQIFSGLKLPSRDKALALCLGMNLTLEEVQNFLRQNQYPVLYPRAERDCAFIYAFQHSLSVMDLNELLFEMNQPLLN